MVLNVFASVSDKSGLAAALRELSKQYDLKITSSGGTAKHLTDEGFEVEDVQALTGFQEVFGGRVKTLHPMVHMGLLYRNEEDRRELERQGGRPFHVVIANLYPFEEAAAAGSKNLVEYIDIGGVALLRAAAKNFEHVAVFSDSQDYWRMADAVASLEIRQDLARKVFRTTSHLDDQIAQKLFGEDTLTQRWSSHRTLRYGENPQQRGWWLTQGSQGWQQAKILQGKEMSFNNFLDLESCLRTLLLLNAPAVVAVKHNNPCGAAEADQLLTALDRALKADPISVFGGVVALSGPVGAAEAELLSGLFLEVVLAPQFLADGLEVLRKKKNLRLVEWPEMLQSQAPLDVRPIRGGAVRQDAMLVEENPDNWEIFGQPLKAQERQDALLALKVVSELRSNAIAIVAGGQTLGLGMGQVNRVDAVEHALHRAKKFHGDVPHWTLASDAFFPFPDSIELMAPYPVQTVIQPGGSIKDDDVLAASQKLGRRMILTGRRYFRH